MKIVLDVLQVALLCGVSGYLMGEMVVWCYRRLARRWRSAAVAFPRGGNVELRPAWVFVCDRCGLDTFVRAVVPCELEDQWPDDLDPELCHSVEWITQPKRVTCDHCWAEFGVEVEGEGL